MRATTGIGPLLVSRAAMSGFEQHARYYHGRNTDSSEDLADSEALGRLLFVAAPPDFMVINRPAKWSMMAMTTDAPFRPTACD
jgi:hypothetical protein